MPATYLTLFDAVGLSMDQVIASIEPILASNGHSFDGVARRLERHDDGALYYCLETIDVGSLSEGIKEASERSWPGVALECHVRGQDSTIGVFSDESGTTVSFDDEGVLHYERADDRDVFKEWLGVLLRCSVAIGAKVCVVQKGGKKCDVHPELLIEAVREGRLERRENPILVLAHRDLIDYEDTAVLDLDRFRVRETVTGYILVTWLHPGDD